MSEIDKRDKVIERGYIYIYIYIYIEIERIDIERGWWVDVWWHTP